MNEFQIIQQYFNQQKISRSDVLLGIGDDAAIVTVPKDQQLVITTDTCIAGTHFPNDSAAFDIGYKSLAVNLSDLAAMGATPAWFTLALTLPNADDDWLKEFCRGLFELAHPYHIQLIGGDLTRGALSITIQAMGFTHPNEVLRRDKAMVGDLIYVTHTLGDAALALALLKKQQVVPPALLNRLNRPEPQIDIGKKLRHFAHAAIDISDGLAADLQHILERSEVGAIIDVATLPLSHDLTALTTEEEAIHFALTGGDDYELCFTIPENHIHQLDFPCTCIGKITAHKQLDLRYHGHPYTTKLLGYQHFK